MYKYFRRSLSTQVAASDFTELNITHTPPIGFTIIFAFKRFRNHRSVAAAPPACLRGRANLGNKLPFMISRVEYLYCTSNFYPRTQPAMAASSPGEFLVLSVLQTTQTDSKSAARSVYLLEIDARLKCQFALLLRRHVAARSAHPVCMFEVNAVCRVCCLRRPHACRGRFASKQQHTHTRRLRVDAVCVCMSTMYKQRGPCCLIDLHIPGAGWTAGWTDA